MTKKNYCDICEREVKCTVVKYENGVTICKKHDTNLQA